MRLDLLNAFLLVTDPIGRYLTAQISNQTLGRTRNSGRHSDRIDAAQNRIVGAHVILATERWLADKQLMHENAECPIVDGPIVTLVQDDFGRNVFGCSREGPGFIARWNDFSKTEVDLFRCAGGTMKESYFVCVCALDTTVKLTNFT